MYGRMVLLLFRFYDAATQVDDESWWDENRMMASAVTLASSLHQVEGRLPLLNSGLP